MKVRKHNGSSPEVLDLSVRIHTDNNTNRQYPNCNPIPNLKPKLETAAFATSVRA